MALQHLLMIAMALKRWTAYYCIAHKYMDLFSSSHVDIFRKQLWVLLYKSKVSFTLALVPASFIEEWLFFFCGTISLLYFGSFFFRLLDFILALILWLLALLFVFGFYFNRLWFAFFCFFRHSIWAKMLINYRIRS